MDGHVSKKAVIDVIDNFNVFESREDQIALERKIAELPSAEPEIIHCEKCQFSEYDALYDDRYCHYDGKAEVVPDEHFCGYGRERQNG